MRVGGAGADDAGGTEGWIEQQAEVQEQEREAEVAGVPLARPEAESKLG